MSKRSIDDIIADVDRGEEKGKPSKTPVNFKKKRKRNWKKIIFLLLLLTFLAGGAFFGIKAYTVAKKIFQGGGSAPGLLGFLSPGQLKGEGSGRINILLLGVGGDGHEGGDLSDTNIVVSIDPRTKEAAMLSIPRDLYVKIDGYGYAKINAANAYGERYKYQGGGPALAKTIISETLDIPIHYYVRIDFTGFQKIIDTVGGVDVNVENDLYDPLYPGGTFSIKKGPHHMDGKLALKYARSRETTSDFDRAKRQQQILVALRDKVMSASTLLNVQKMNDILSALGSHVRTDMQMWEAQKLANMGKEINKDKIVNRVLDNGPDGLLMNGNSPGGRVYISA